MPDIHSAFPPDSHRGGFGEHGGEEDLLTGLFRENNHCGFRYGEEKDLSIAAQMTELERRSQQQGLT